MVDQHDDEQAQRERPRPGRPRRTPIGVAELVERRRTLPPVDPDQLRRDLATVIDDTGVPTT